MADDARDVMREILQSADRPPDDGGHRTLLLAQALQIADERLEHLQGQLAARTPNEVVCKGSWMLGSACGRCERCRDEAVASMPAFIAATKVIDQVKQLLAVVKTGSPTLRTVVLDELAGIIK